MSLGVEWVSKYESRDLVVYQSVYTEICCSNKLPQSLWLKTTQVFPHTSCPLWVSCNYATQLIYSGIQANRAAPICCISGFMARRKENIIAEYCKRKVTLKASDWKCLWETYIFISLAKESHMDNFDVSGVEKNKPCIGRGSENFEQSYNLPQAQVHPQRKGLDALVWLDWRNLNTDCWQLGSAETY